MSNDSMHYNNRIQVVITHYALMVFVFHLVLASVYLTLQRQSH